MKPYLLVAWDFVRTGGMDMANYALAAWLADHGHEVHLVAHSASAELTSKPNIVFHRIPKIGGTYVLSEPLLDRMGRAWANRISRQGGRVLVNGGNCSWRDLNWVHYVHAAYTPQVRGNAVRRLKWRWSHSHSLKGERSALRGARLIFANSRMTRDHLIDRLGVSEEQVRIVYYGVDRDRFRPAAPNERAAARKSLGFDDRPKVAFVGGLGDRRKGFDTLFEAWRLLCQDPSWDADLVVVGTGAELEAWREASQRAGIEKRVNFLGFRSDVDRILAASDALVAPTRYEAYGLGVHEAICCGLPAFVTRTAGVAERYPSRLSEFLLSDPDDSDELRGRLLSWRARREIFKPEFRAFSDRMRERTWNDMADEMFHAAEAAA